MNTKPSGIILPPSEPQDNEPEAQPARKINCTMCRHFDRPKLGMVDGNCLRYPPVVAFIGMQPHQLSNQMMPVTHQFVPTVGPMFCCGEFSAKPQDLQ